MILPQQEISAALVFERDVNIFVYVLLQSVSDRYEKCKQPIELAHLLYFIPRSLWILDSDWMLGGGNFRITLQRLAHSAGLA